MVQKSYLGNKAIVRYLMEVISDRGGTDDLTKFLTENTDRTDLQHTVNSTKAEWGYEPQGAWASAFKYGHIQGQRVPNRYLNYATPWSNRGETFLPGYAMPKDRKLLDRVAHLQTQQRRALHADPTARAHSTGAGQQSSIALKDKAKPPETDPAWGVSITGTKLAEKPPPDDLIADHYKPGSQAPKSYGVLEGKQKRVRFVDHKGKEGIMRSDEEIRAIFIRHGSRTGTRGRARSRPA